MNQLQIEPCIKCGSREYRIKYIPDRTDSQVSLATQKEIVHVIEKCDYIQVTCDECDYEWRVAPLDKMAKPPEHCGQS